MRSKRTPWAMWLLLCSTVGWGQTGGPPEGAPRAEVKPARWDLGKVEPGQFRQVFDVANTGSGVLKIDEVRVSNPQRMNASVAAIGTDEGKRFQLTVAVSTEGLEEPFTGFVLLHCNDKEHEHIKIEVTAERGVPASGLLIFYSDEGGITKVKERIEKLPKDLKQEVLYLGDVANVDRLRPLEKEHGVTQGGAYELFLGKDWLVTSAVDDVLAAIDRLVAGKPLTGKEPIQHEHQEGEEAEVAQLLPPPLVIDIFLDPTCEACQKEVREGADAFLPQYGGRVLMRPRDITHPDVVKALKEGVPAKDLPPQVHALAVLGTTYVAGEVPRIFEALGEVVDRAIAASAPPQSLSSPSYNTEVRLAPGAEPVSANPGPPYRGQDEEPGSPGALWLLVLMVAFFQCLTMVRVSRLVARLRGTSPDASSTQAKP